MVEEEEEIVQTILPRLGAQSDCAFVLYKKAKAFRKLVTCAKCQDGSHAINDCKYCAEAFRRETEVSPVLSAGRNAGGSRNLPCRPSVVFHQAFALLRKGAVDDDDIRLQTISFPVSQSFRKFIFPRACMDLFGLVEFQGSRLHQNAIIHVVRSIAHALDACHRLAHLAHLDIKPENILVFDDGTVKLTDFGLSKSRASLFQSTSWYGNVMYVGTQAYWPPEIDMPVYDIEDLYRRDIWSLGAVMINTFLGLDCFRDEAHMLWMEKEIKKGPSIVQGLKLLMLQDDPRNRVTSKELVLHLDSIPYGTKEDVSISFRSRKESKEQE